MGGRAVHPRHQKPGFTGKSQHDQPWLYFTLVIHYVPIEEAQLILFLTPFGGILRDYKLSVPIWHLSIITFYGKNGLMSQYVTCFKSILLNRVYACRTFIRHLCYLLDIGYYHL